ncbi:DUF418 domain-containing protein [Auraticoccus monumenti]|nr:DUF418 domain-containing protein [Auraticoccus monumenti]
MVQTARESTVTSSRPRLVGVDAARGLALLGMFVAHAAPRGAADGWDHLLLEAASERSRLLFAVTAGLGLGLLTGGSAPSADRTGLRRRIAVRGLFLLVLGSLLTLLDPPVRVILDEYGAAFLLVLPVLFLPRRWLLGAGAAGVVLLSGLAAALGTVPAVRGQRSEPWGFLVDWLVTGAYPLLIWVPVLLLTLGCVRLDLARTRRVAVIAVLALGAAVVGLLVGGLVATPVEVAVGSTVRGVPRLALGTSLTVAGNVALGLAVALGLVLLTSSAGLVGRVARRALSPLAAAGSMPLTLYTAHVLLLELLAGEDRRLDDSWALVAGLVVGSLVVGWAWRRWMGRGPLEQLVVALSAPSRRGPTATP